MRKDLIILILTISISLVLCLGKYYAWINSILYPALLYIFLMVMFSFYMLMDQLVKAKNQHLTKDQVVKKIILLIAIPIHLLCMYCIYYYSSHNQYIIANVSEEVVEVLDVLGCEQKKLDWKLKPGEIRKYVIQADELCRNLLILRINAEKINLTIETPKHNSKNRILHSIP